MRAVLLTGHEFRLPRRRVLLGVGHGFVGPAGLSGQGQTGGLDGFVPDMEQVRRVLGAELLFSEGDQRRRFVTGDLGHRHRPPRQPLVEGLIPGRGVALRSVLFQQQIIGELETGSMATKQIVG
jgi:hypothetical protein